mgnify:FL=1
MSAFNDLPFPKSRGSDNHSGVHPKILQGILDANRGHAHSYGMDPISDLAKQEFERIFQKEPFVFYVFNGTAANVLALGSFLKSYESALCSDQAHLNLDECGAPEVLARTKLTPLPSYDGKIRPEDAEKLFERQGDQHHVQLKKVSLTQPTELGTVYSMKELRTWKDFCKKRGLYLHCDGARLANALKSKGHQLSDYAQIFDVISFGGTKNGLLGAEAVVLFDSERAKDLKFIRKQFLNLPSKTRFLAAQFYTYLQNDLYLEMAEKVLDQAQYLKSKLQEFPEVKIHFPVESNAVFASFPKHYVKELKKSHFFYIWDSQKSMARLMISFDWTTNDTDQFIQCLQELKNKDGLLQSQPSNTNEASK